MEINEKQKEENSLLHRKEIELTIKDYEETPSRKKILEKISANLGYDEDKIVIDKIDQEYGKKESKCSIKVYDSKEDLEKYSKKYKSTRTEQEEEE